MRLLRFCILGALCLLALAPPPILMAQEEQWLQYRYDREASSIVGGTMGARLGLKTEQPEGVKLPKFKRDPLFDQWKTPMVEAGFLHIALDRSSANGPYDLLYLDRNANGHLDDEKPLKPYRTDSRSARWGPVKIVFEGEDGPITYHINLRSYYRNDYRYLYVEAGGWYEGTIELAGKSLICTLTDYNGNGAFNDRSKDLYQADRIAIGPKDRSTKRMVGKLLEVDDILYALEIAQDGAFVVLEKAKDVVYGEVHLAKNITSFGAGGSQGQFDREPKEGVVKLPVGDYRIEHWAIDRKESGQQWRLQGSSFGDKGNFTVSAEKVAELKVGEPVVATLSASVNGSKYSFRQGLEGSLKERINLTQGGNRRPRAPKLHIKSADGKYERTYNFSYG